jgi:hypothetical protein
MPAGIRKCPVIKNQKNWETLMKVLSALALASILLLGATKQEIILAKHGILMEY